MAIVFDGPISPDTLTTFVRTVPIPASNALSQLFPVRTFDSNRIDWAELTKTNRTAQYRSFDGTIHVSKRDAGTGKYVELAPFSDSLNKGEYERIAQALERIDDDGVRLDVGRQVERTGDVPVVVFMNVGNNKQSHGSASFWPMPAAAGLFCAAGDARYRGDSQRVVAAVNDALLPDVAGTLPIMEDLYYGPDVDFRDPLVSPVFSDAVLRQFPPTLLITATRAAELSNASYTHARLVDLGRESDLHVWDGLGHAFHLTDTLPESQQALRVMARFFSKHLGLPPPPLPASR